MSSQHLDFWDHHFVESQFGLPAPNQSQAINTPQSVTRYGSILYNEDDQQEQPGHERLQTHFGPALHTFSPQQAPPLPTSSSSPQWQFYGQRKEMIARHHWKLTNQDMTASNCHRCIQMLIKHHFKLIHFMENLPNEGQTDPELRDQLVKEHATLLETSRLVLVYFEVIRMPLLQETWRRMPLL